MVMQELLILAAVVALLKVQVHQLTMLAALVVQVIVALPTGHKEINNGTSNRVRARIY
jgi:hypothetical protein